MVRTDVVAVMVWGCVALFGGMAFYSCMTAKRPPISAEPPVAVPNGLPSSSGRP